jgi:hypothetical protein
VWLLLLFLSIGEMKDLLEKKPVMWVLGIVFMFVKQTRLYQGGFTLIKKRK